MTAETPRRRKSVTPEQMEKRMMALAVERSEQRLRDGTASSAEIVYWLNQGSIESQLKRQNLEMQNEVLKAKRDAIIAEQKSNKDYARALEAFSGYIPSQDDNVIDGEYREI